MSRGARARLFVAVDPPPDACDALSAWARAAAGGLDLRARRGARRPLRVLAPESLHVTLCFLGARPVEEIDTIAGAVGGCSGVLGELRVGAPLWLPPRRPRSLGVEVHDDRGELTALQGGLSRAISGVTDWEPERRRFRAHVTLARIGAGVAVGSAPREPDLPATPALRFAPEAIVLYRSLLSPSGASYEPLASSFLEPPARQPPGD